MFDLFKNLMFSAKDSSMLNKKMTSGDSHNFSHTSRYLSDVGAAKIAAVFGAVSFFAIGAKGLLDFFAPSNRNNNRMGGNQRRERR